MKSRHSGTSCSGMFRRTVGMAQPNENDLFAEFDGNAPLTTAELEQFRRECDFELPKDYLEFLQRWNGGRGFIGRNGYVNLRPLGELVESNKAYHVDELAPGLFIFGSNGGSEAFAFDTRTSPMPVVSVQFIGMDLEELWEWGANFTDFLDVLSKIED